MKKLTADAACEFVIQRVRELPTVGAEGALDNPEKVAAFWYANVVTAPWWQDDKEFVVVITLNSKLRPTGFNLVSMGTLSESLASPREVFRPAIAAAAHSIVMVHNHPSGDPTPSDADRRLTKRMTESASILLIPLLDHVIIGANIPGTAGRFSFQEAGLL